MQLPTSNPGKAVLSETWECRATTPSHAPQVEELDSFAEQKTMQTQEWTREIRNA